MSASPESGAAVVDLDLAGRATIDERARARVIVRFRHRVLGTLNLPGRDPRPVRERAVRQSVRRLLAELVLPEVPDPETWPPVTIVVCTRSRAEGLGECLASLAALDYPDFEVVVVDNAPDDDSTKRVTDEHGVRYVLEPKPGLDWARNTGFVAARTELVAYTDDDARPEPGWLRGLARAFESPAVAAAAGLVIPGELETDAQRLFENVYRGMGKGYDFRMLGGHNRQHALRPELVGTGCNMAFRRATLEALGGFDPALDVGTATRGGGDLDAFVRVMERGEVIAYRPDAVVRHFHRRTMPELRQQLRDNGSGYVAMLLAAFGRAQGRDRARIVRRYCAWMIQWQLMRVVRRVVRRERLPMRLILAEVHGALRGVWAYRRARRAAARLATGGRGT
ncbi:MAG: glycosyltransferase [Gaiellales bacterium]